jgi:uncharacterized repeat protein (TIGR03803 family)
MRYQTAICIVLACLCGQASGKDKILYTFGQTTNDGIAPNGVLISDPQGNLYGTTYSGGSSNQGTVFQLSPNHGQWSETTLYSFRGDWDGGKPNPGLAFDKAGNLYGTTYYGGAGNYDIGGVLFELEKGTGGWAYSVLFDFSASNTNVGFNPVGNLLFDKAGNLYGITGAGGMGLADWCGDTGCGLIFQMRPPSLPGNPWSQSVLHYFLVGPGSDGYGPVGITFGAGGVLYGSTRSGARYYPKLHAYEYVAGYVFQLRPAANGAWTYELLYGFSPFDSTYGSYPNSVTFWRQNLYGTTLGGGTFAQGLIFELSPGNGAGAWVESELYNFTGGSDGARPEGGVIFDTAGNLYTTATLGGILSCPFWTTGCGAVIRLAPGAGGVWSERTLYDFQGGLDGALPLGNLFLTGDSKGDSRLLGMTAFGGSSANSGPGTFFEIKP